MDNSQCIPSEQYKKLLAQADEALYQAYEGYDRKPIGVGSQCSGEQAQVVLDALWPVLEAQLLEAGKAGFLRGLVAAEKNPEMWDDQNQVDAATEAAKKYLDGED
ncbi:MAG TPA: hypothetical protein VJ742_12825 [Nitrososphaera sp.]|nr:hypothetical protein [Nitrososphaera sp.]